MNVRLSANRRIALAIAVILGAQASANSTDVPLSRSIGAPALSTSNLSIEGGMLFEASFDRRTFEGDLVARALDSRGFFTPDEFYPGDPDAAGYVLGKGGQLKKFNGLWQAKIIVTEQSRRAGGSPLDNRTIFTSGNDGSGAWSGRRFSWDNSSGDALTDTMKTAINSDSLSDAESDPVVNWTRGQDSHEGTKPGNLRPRPTVLGDLTYTAPVYVGPPNGVFSDSAYAEFRAANRNRPPLVFAGGSDGMLHAFRAIDGIELFAYIPREILTRLKQRTIQQYSDRPLVGGPIVAADAFGEFPRCSASPCWRSVLVGGLGPGGRSFFALDITTPGMEIGETNKEANAARMLFLWEFRHQHLGLTSTRPLIRKLSDGTWVAVFGSGKKPGKSILFVVDIADGELLYEIETPSTSGTNGLSSPAGWDADFDGNLDIVYAGDLEGNLWKFDFAQVSGDPNDGNNPTVALSGKSLIKVSGPDSNVPRPITTGTLVTVKPNGELIVFFGTSSIAEMAGTSGSVYGITDKNESWGTNPPLTMHAVDPIHHIDDSKDEGPTTYRIISSSTVPDSPIGWQLQLPRGEHLLQDPILNNHRIEFTSSAATNRSGYKNWFMGVDYRTGDSPASPYLDLNADGTLDTQDVFVDTNDDGGFTENDDFRPVGRFIGSGVASAPISVTIAGGMDSAFIMYEPTPRGVSSRFTDPGVEGGQVDQDNFDRSPGQFAVCAGQKPDGRGSVCDTAMSCWGGADQSSVCHTDGYDDEWDVDGVNMLHKDGSVSAPPDVESATGILSPAHKALYQAIIREQEGAAGSGLREYDASIGDEIRIWIKNPNSVDTLGLVDRRITAGLEPAGSVPAVPATLYFDCDKNDDGIGDNRIVIDAPGFNLLPVSDRTCAIENIRELRVRHNDINALRATDPVCVALHHTTAPPESLGAQSVANPNSAYRNGAFTVQAIATGRRKPFGANGAMGTSPVAAGVVIWENSNYEHFGEGCSAFNEALRAEKIPLQNSTGNSSSGGGDSSPGSTPVVVDGAGDSQLTKNIDVARSNPEDGRVSWREVLE